MSSCRNHRVSTWSLLKKLNFRNSVCGTFFRRFPVGTLYGRRSIDLCTLNHLFKLLPLVSWPLPHNTKMFCQVSSIRTTVVRNDNPYLGNSVWNAEIISPKKVLKVVYQVIPESKSLSNIPPCRGTSAW